MTDGKFETWPLPMPLANLNLLSHRFFLYYKINNIIRLFVIEKVERFSI